MKVVGVISAIIIYALLSEGNPLGVIFMISWFIVLAIRIDKKRVIKNVNQNVNTINEKIPGILIKCVNCETQLSINEQFCPKCGTAFSGNNVKVEMNLNYNQPKAQKKIVTTKDYDSIFQLDEEKMIEEFINRELKKANVIDDKKLIPNDILKRKNIFNTIFSFLVFIYISMIFFHFPILTYIIGLIILIIFFKLTRSYDLIKYLKKQLKARPSEKVSNIIMSTKSSLVNNNSKKILLLSMTVAIILPMIIFIDPIILYEKMDNGYGVRYYTFGLTNYTTATIPETYKNQKVISLRGNTFSNMPFLKEVNLPETIMEIRGQAFKNNKSLATIKLPNSLEYLGGGAFYNCKSLKTIEIPDSVTYIGGEAFYNAKSLETVKLSNNITEIRGSTFENCTSLKTITIPDSVTRIGGHAFYGNNSLSEVVFTENSLLTEIGSSAFRKCNTLYNITLPKDTYVNSRAFKESPTIIKRFGEINYGSLINSDDYTYDSFLYIRINESEEINKYRSHAQLQKAYITLISVTPNNGYNEFTLKYNDTDEEQIFTLTSENSYKIISDKVAVEIESKYAFDYYNTVSLNIYYN